ncbi:MAG: hypothetical protein M0Z52_08400 [Actinomycetota bacterium]|nr:hypothetical protein [Actinomycetota bacterium]
MQGLPLAYLVQQRVKYIADIDLKVQGGSTVIADVGTKCLQGRPGL